jgi:uncharacterized protein (TIGR00255 family)
MTGHGEAHLHEDGLEAGIELRTINSRFLKVSIRSSEGYSSLEPQIESLLRQLIRRGTIQATVRASRVHSAEDYQLNAAVLDGYRRQLEKVCQSWKLPRAVSLEALLPLPGVVNADCEVTHDVNADWPLLRRALDMAVVNLNQMRAEEGRTMAADMLANCRVVSQCVEQIRSRAPLVIETYRKRLIERIGKVLEEFQVTLNPADLVREVALFAERSDISEEIVRLDSHLEQFETIMNLPESSGRKLEFLIQEMFRETNTIGSKSYDVEIARVVIEIKTAIERLREMIQNVE